MTLKQQPQIRVIDPESEFFGGVFRIQEMSYQYEQILPCKGANVFDFDQVQELTPLSHDGVRIGVGDEVNNCKVVGYSKTTPFDGDGYTLHTGRKGVGSTPSFCEWQITQHRPLTEMKKEDPCVCGLEYVTEYLKERGWKNLAELVGGDDTPTKSEAVDAIVDDFEKDWCGCEMQDGGAFVCDEHLADFSVGDETPTVERFISELKEQKTHYDGMETVAVDADNYSTASRWKAKKEAVDVAIDISIDHLEALEKQGIINLEE